MKTKNRVLLSCLFAAIFVVMTAILGVQLFTQKTSATNGTYNGAFKSFAAEVGETTNNTIGETQGMFSVDKEYLLLATSFDVDDVANYKELGYKVTVGDATEAEKVGAGNLSYTGIVVKTGDTTTKEFVLGENIFAGVTADGMIVAEMLYDAEADYTIQPYILHNDGTTEITATAVTLEHTHVVSALTVTSQPTSNKIASYGTLDTTGMQIDATCSVCQETQETQNVTASCEQSAYEHGDVVTFTYADKTVDVSVEEVTGYEVKVEKVSGCAIGSGNNYNMNKMPDEYPDDSRKTNGYVGGTTNSATNQFKIHSETTYYQGEYAGQTLNKIGNFDANETITYFVWSDVAGYAQVSILASMQSGNAGETVAAVSLNTRFTLEVNGAEVVLPATAKTKEFVNEKKYAMDFSEVVLTDMQLNVGWNTVKICPISGMSQPQLSTMFFNFTQKLESKAVTPVLEGMSVTEEPTPDTLAGYEDTGLIYLSGNSKVTIGEEGSTIAVKNAIQGSIVTYYVYFEKAVVADVKLVAASAAYYKTDDATYEGSTPNAVRGVTFGTDVLVSVNGTAQTCSENAAIAAYQQETGSWAVYQRFTNVELMNDVSFNAGWNTVTFTVATTNVANFAELQFTWVA